MMKPITAESLGDQYAEYVRPRLARLLKLLKLDRVYESAHGDWIEPLGDRPVLDLLGGYGSTLLGHNHPELVRELRGALDRGVPAHAQASIRPGASEIALKLNHLLAEHGHDGRKFVVTLCNSGAEAVEAAIKHALMEWQIRREYLISSIESLRADHLMLGQATDSWLTRIDDYLLALEQVQPVLAAVEGGFHGKTAGAISVTANPEFKGMYAASPVRSLFFLREESDEAVTARAREESIESPDPGIPAFSAIAAVILEPIQGEGGIQCLSARFATRLARTARESGAPLIADEIQCGLFRTGSFLASHELGIQPDYILLGKSLGGGIAKISALLVERSRYVEKFGHIHTSTFAEDEPSSLVASKTLDLLAFDARGLKSRAERFEAAVRDRVASIQAKFPGVLSEVRGKGFLLGIEFNLQDNEKIPTILHTIHQAGFAGYIFASYLLHHHSIRCGVTLSKPDTLRIQPSAWISEADTQRFLDALGELCALLHDRKLVAITRHLWSSDLTERVIQTASPPRYPAIKRTSAPRKVGFLCHMIDETHFRLIDPFMRAIGKEGCSRFESKFGPVTGPVIFHEQEIQGANGRSIHLHCYGVFLASKFFEDSHRSGDGQAFAQVEEMAKRARRDGMDFVGLGQYTSIVSKNGLLLRRHGINLTTGNGLTAGFACQGIGQLLAESGRSLQDSKIGVVGAAGNICGVMAQVLADDARQMLLVFREGTHESPKARMAADQVVRHSRLSSDRLRISGSLDALRDCDVVVIGTNSAGTLLLPEHLKPNAIVMDVSVPSNIDPRVYAERPDVRCYQGGRARLPLGQALKSDWLPAPIGETYACMGETICAGLVDQSDHLSFGLLTKATVQRALEMAKATGMEMGSLRRVTRV